MVGLFAALALCGAAVAVGWKLLDLGGTKEVDRTGPAVLMALRDMARFRAATGTFQVVVDVENDVKLLPDFVAGERTLLVATGTVDAEVDLANLGAESVVVSEDRTKVTITLPHAALDPRPDRQRQELRGQPVPRVLQTGSTTRSGPTPATTVRSTRRPNPSSKRRHRPPNCGCRPRKTPGRCSPS